MRVAVIHTVGSVCRCAEAIAQGLQALGHEPVLADSEEMEYRASELAGTCDLIIDHTDTFRGRGLYRALVRMLLEVRGARLVGSDATACFLADDKAAAKAKLGEAGIPTPPGILVTCGEWMLPSWLIPPLVLKPAFEHMSRGLQLAQSEDEARRMAAAMWERLRQPALEDGLERIRSLDNANVSFGLHLNLSEGKPLSSGLRLLTGSDGGFLGKAAAQQVLMRGADAALEKEVEQEVAARIRLLQDCGIRIRHLDGHQHVHVFPAVVRVAVEAARRNGIPWMRLPEEPCPPTQTGTMPDALMEEAWFFFEHAREASAILHGHTVRTTDYFCGLYWKGSLSLPLLVEFLGVLPTGLTELMVHPGQVPDAGTTGPFSGFSTEEREQELKALLDPDFRLALDAADVTLTPFPEYVIR